MSSTRRDDDPTGVSRLLSGLSDPHPMPDDLVDRIAASLQEEQDERASGHPTHRFDPAVSPVRRRWVPRAALLGSAGLALVGVLAIVIAPLLGVGATQNRGTADTAHALSAPVGADADTVGVHGAAASSPSRSATSSARAAAPVIVVLATGTAYRSGLLTDDARHGLLAPRIGRVSTGDTPYTPLASWDVLQRCLQGMSLMPGSTVLVDVATLDGESAVVLVTGDGPERSVTVVPPTCGTSTHFALAGPTRLR